MPKLINRKINYIVYPFDYEPGSGKFVECKTEKAAFKAAYKIGRQPTITVNHHDYFANKTEHIYTHCNITVFTKP
jgi:hypothetical protein